MLRQNEIYAGTRKRSYISGAGKCNQKIFGPERTAEILKYFNLNP
jgi:hypothetical protein